MFWEKRDQIGTREWLKSLKLRRVGGEERGEGVKMIVQFIMLVCSKPEWLTLQLSVLDHIGFEMNS